MADSTRAALAESDAVIARIRTRLAGTKITVDGREVHGDFIPPFVTLSRETSLALRVADEWERYVVELRFASWRRARAARRAGPSVTARLMAQDSPAGAVA